MAPTISALPTKMRRYVLDHRSSLEGIKLQEDVPVPKIKSPTELLIKIKAISLNARDLQIATSTYPGPLKFIERLVPVSDASGEVVAVGDGVTSFKIGDRVSPIVLPGHHFGEDPQLSSVKRSLGGGAHGVAAEYLTCEEADAVHIPSHFTYEDAATLPVAYATAWASFYGHHPKLQPGQTVLCQGTGGVSLAAAQLALIGGAKVILTSSSEKKIDRALAVLAPLAKSGKPEESVKTINYAEIPKWDEEVKRLTDGKGVDFVIEIAGKTTIGKSVRSVKAGGLVVVVGYLSAYGSIPKEILEEDLATLILISSAYVRGTYICNREALKNMVSAFEVANLKPVIDRTFPFHELKDAYQYVADGKHFGKVVISV